MLDFVSLGKRVILFLFLFKHYLWRLLCLFLFVCIFILSYIFWNILFIISPNLWLLLFDKTSLLFGHNPIDIIILCITIDYFFLTIMNFNLNHLIRVFGRIFRWMIRMIPGWMLWLWILNCLFNNHWLLRLFITYLADCRKNLDWSYSIVYLV